MSFLSKLKIEGDEMNVLECSFEFTQESDYNGRPSENPKGGKISILIESTSKTDFLDWMVSPNMTKNGVVTFFQRENMASLKKVEFTNAYCLYYKEHFNALSSEPLKTTIVISANIISVRGTEHRNNWPTSV